MMSLVLTSNSYIYMYVFHLFPASPPPSPLNAHPSFYPIHFINHVSFLSCHCRVAAHHAPLRSQVTPISGSLLPLRSIVRFHSVCLSVCRLSLLPAVWFTLQVPVCVHSLSEGDL